MYNYYRNNYIYPYFFYTSNLFYIPYYNKMYKNSNKYKRPTPNPPSQFDPSLLPPQNEVEITSQNIDKFLKEMQELSFSLEYKIDNFDLESQNPLEAQKKLANANKLVQEAIKQHSFWNAINTFYDFIAGSITTLGFSGGPLATLLIGLVSIIGKYITNDFLKSHDDTLDKSNTLYDRAFYLYQKKLISEYEKKYLDLDKELVACEKEKDFWKKKYEQECTKEPLPKDILASETKKMLINNYKGWYVDYDLELTLFEDGTLATEIKNIKPLYEGAWASLEFNAYPKNYEYVNDELHTTVNIDFSGYSNKWSGKVSGEYWGPTDKEPTKKQKEVEFIFKNIPKDLDIKPKSSKASYKGHTLESPKQI